MKKNTFSCLVLLLFAVATAFGAVANNQFVVITWGGNSPDWNRVLHLSGVRLGCSDAPASCIQQADQIATSQRVSSVFLAILLNPANVAANSAAYGSFSLSHPNLAEVGFDDFVSQCEKTHLGPAQLSSLLETVAANLKSRSSKLHLGATIYQDQLVTGELNNLQLTDAARQSIDIVHLFPHYRKERKSVTDYVAEAKRAFPNARVVLGVYAYDRRDYLPCSADSRTPCSVDEEINLFDQTLREDLRIASTGGVAGIEFFPGDFGGEDTWKGWNNARACKQEEREACVQNTVAMRQRVREAMGNAAP
jgi:hypothetical protein